MHASLKIISVLLTAVLVIGCVATYKAAEDGVAGYRDLRVNKNTYYVEYTEAARVSWDQLHAFVLKRCAEIAKENGYDVFDVLDKDEKEVFFEE